MTTIWTFDAWNKSSLEKFFSLSYNPYYLESFLTVMWLYFWSVVVFLLYSREKWSSCWYIYLPSSIWTIFESSIVFVFSVNCLVYQVDHCDSVLIKNIGSFHWRVVSIVPLLSEVCVNCLYHSMTKSNTLHLQTQFRIKNQLSPDQ